MAAVVSLNVLLEAGRLWRGQAPLACPASPEPTGHAVLDAALPGGGWPEAALSEILLPADGGATSPWSRRRMCPSRAHGSLPAWISPACI